MNDELKTRYIFIDTSMYERENFQFHEHALEHVKTLCREKTLHLLMNQIVENEVRSHLREKAHEAANAVKQFKKTIKILRNLPELGHYVIFNELKGIAVEELLIQKFQDFIDEAVYETIDINLASITEVVAKYFDKKPPFSQKKKNEFSDAIMLESLLEWAKSKQTQIYILSADGDMKRFCEAHKEWLFYVGDLNKFLDLVQRDKEEFAYRFANEQFQSLLSEITLKLEDEIKSIEYVSSGNDFDDEIFDADAYGLDLQIMTVLIGIQKTNNIFY